MLSLLWLVPPRVPDPPTLATLTITTEVEVKGSKDFGTKSKSQRSKERIEERLFYQIFFQQLYTMPPTGEPLTPSSEGDSSPYSSSPSPAISCSGSASAHSKDSAPLHTLHPLSAPNRTSPLPSPFLHSSEIVPWP